MLVLWILLGLVALFVAVLLIRTALFRPAALPQGEALPVEFDKQKAIDDLQAMIRCRTVSDKDPAKEQEEEKKAPSRDKKVTPKKLGKKSDGAE